MSTDARPSIEPVFEIIFRIDLQPQDRKRMTCASIRKAMEDRGAEDELALTLWRGSGPGADLAHGRVVLDRVVEVPEAPADPAAALTKAEEAYLHARGWQLKPGFNCLWQDPRDPNKTHIDRKAAYLQRQRDTEEENERLKRERWAKERAGR